MPAWNPLLIQKIEIHALGFVLRKLQLNRHRDTEVAPHTHSHAQLILYLAGEGFQSVGRRRRLARAGDLFVIPPRTPHGFALAERSPVNALALRARSLELVVELRTPNPPRASSASSLSRGARAPSLSRGRPLCLVLDYDLDHPTRMRAAHRRLGPQQLAELHTLLARVPAKGRLTLSDYSPVLAVVARLLEQTPPPAPVRAPTVFEQVHAQLHSAAPLAHVARAAGYHPDHLTRKLKDETGLGLRAHRDRLRLASAQAALRAAASVTEAATRAGFDDPNYFARWFRRQTGKSPSAWRTDLRGRR